MARGVEAVHPLHQLILVAGEVLVDLHPVRLVQDIDVGARIPGIEEELHQPFSRARLADLRAAGTPVRAQLLGSDPACLADNAARLAALGPAGIDLNFGCPAKVVNRHGGGAALLETPELIHQIVKAVRQAVPRDMPVSAKMRLGFLDDSRAEECAKAIEEAGADELVVHARTKAHGYRPPAYWSRIADVRATVRIPVIANGEVWTVDDALQCLQESGCDALMLGRGVDAPMLERARALHREGYGWGELMDALDLRLDVALMAVVGYFLLSIHTFIAAKVVGEFRLSYMAGGPTELRLMLMAMTALMPKWSMPIMGG